MNPTLGVWWDSLGADDPLRMSVGGRVAIEGTLRWMKACSESFDAVWIATDDGSAAHALRSRGVDVRARLGDPTVRANARFPLLQPDTTAHFLDRARRLAPDERLVAVAAADPHPIRLCRALEPISSHRATPSRRTAGRLELPLPDIPFRPTTLLRVEARDGGDRPISESPWWAVAEPREQELFPDLQSFEGNSSMTPAHLRRRGQRWVLDIPDLPEARAFRIRWTRPAGQIKAAELDAIELRDFWKRESLDTLLVKTDWRTGEVIQGRQQYPTMARTIDALRAGLGTIEIPFEIPAPEALEVRSSMDAVRACLRLRNGSSC